MRIKNIEQYTDSKGKEYIGCKGKLILIDVNFEYSPREREKNNIVLIRTKGQKFSHDKCVEPIIISETEEIEINDWAILLDDLGKVFSIPQQWLGIGILNKNLRKIICLSENFSPEILQQIVNLELKDGDEVMIECNYYDYEKEPFGTIKLTNNYINLIK